MTPVGGEIVASERERGQRNNVQSERGGVRMKSGEPMVESGLNRGKGGDEPSSGSTMGER